MWGHSGLAHHQLRELSQLHILFPTHQGRHGPGAEANMFNDEEQLCRREKLIFLSHICDSGWRIVTGVAPVRTPPTSRRSPQLRHRRGREGGGQGLHRADRTWSGVRGDRLHWLPEDLTGDRHRGPDALRPQPTTSPSEQLCLAQSREQPGPRGPSATALAGFLADMVLFCDYAQDSCVGRCGRHERDRSSAR